MKPLRKFGPPLVDMLAVRSYLEMQSFFDEAFTPGRYYYWKSSLLRGISEDACGRAYRMHAEDADEPGKLLLYAPVAWRRSRVKPADSAFLHQYDHYNCGAMAGWDNEAETEKNIRRSRESWAAMQPYCERNAYVNDLGEEDEQRVREAYGQNYERLLALK